MRILVVAPAWVGDAVLAQPLFTHLHGQHPGLAIDVLAPPWTEALFARMPEVAAVVSAPFPHGALQFMARRRLGRALAARRYAQAIVLPNSFKSALIPFFARIPRRTGYVGELRYGLLNDMRRLDARAHPRMVERFLALAETEAPTDTVGKRAAGPPATSPRLVVDQAQRSATLLRLGLGLDRPVAALCPGAEYGTSKRWPPQYFAQLAQRLAAHGYAVWLIGSPNDATLGADITRQSGGVCVDLCGKTTLAEAIDLLSCAQRVVANDSGLMHIAAALDRPLVALYGSSSPAFTPPLAERARVIYLDLECSPCFERVCPLGHFDCMIKLTTEQVWRQLDVDGATP